jgi:hypothetical protein
MFRMRPAPTDRCKDQHNFPSGFTYATWRADLDRDGRHARGMCNGQISHRHNNSISPERKAMPGCSATRASEEASCPTTDWPDVIWKLLRGVP